MKYLMRIGRWSLFVVVLMAVSFTGRTASAWHVADYGDGGFLNIDYQVQLREAWRNIGSGPAGEDATWDTYLRRDRLSFLGAANETFGYALQFEYNGGRKINDLDVARTDSDLELTVLDAYLTATVSNALQFRAGKTKQVLTREVQEGCFDPLSVDRSQFILGPFSNSEPNKTTRDNGIVALGNLFSDVFQYRLSVMEGNNYGNNMPNDIGYRYTGRVHVSLLDPETGFGYRGSYLGKKKVLTFGAGYDTQANAVYSSGTAGAENYKAYTYDGFFEMPTEVGTFTLSGAYLKADFGNAGVRGVADASGVNGEKNGGYWKAAYMVGKVQLYGRYEKWSFANLDGITGQQITYASEGINYYIKGQDLRLTLDFSKTDFDKASVQGFRTIIAQVQARF